MVYAPQTHNAYYFWATYVDQSQNQHKILRFQESVQCSQRRPMTQMCVNAIIHSFIYVFILDVTGRLCTPSSTDCRTLIMITHHDDRQMLQRQ